MKVAQGARAGWAERAARLFALLSDPCRLQIIEALAKKRGCVSELQLATKRSQPNVSQHLRVLREAGLVAARREGKRVCYSLAHAGAARILSIAKQMGRKR